MNVLEIFHNAYAKLLKHSSKKELAAALYQRYGLRGSFDSWYAHIRKCFSTDERERFEFCDVFFMMLETGELEPLYAMCDLLGLERPKRLTSAQLIEAKRQRLRILETQVSAMRDEVLTLSTMGPDAIQTPRIQGARFKALPAGEPSR